MGLSSALLLTGRTVALAGTGNGVFCDSLVCGFVKQCRSPSHWNNLHRVLFESAQSIPLLPRRTPLYSEGREQGSFQVQSDLSSNARDSCRTDAKHELSCTDCGQCIIMFTCYVRAFVLYKY